MAVTDPIADFMTRIRNAQMAGHRIVDIPASKTKKRITEILYEQGYILKYKFIDEEGPTGIIKIALKYDPVTKDPIIRRMVRVSKPGLRQYRGSTDLPRVLNGMGLAIVSTSHGIMTDKQARAENVGGEVMCFVY